MAGGAHRPAGVGNTETDYFQPWAGLDVSKPLSQLPPGAAGVAQGMDIRGGLTSQPAIVSPIGSNYPIVTPVPFGLNLGDEVISLITNLGGVTVVVTNVAMYSDFSNVTDTAKTFTSFRTFPVGTPYSKGAHFGSVVIGSTLYVSSAEQRGVYAVTRQPFLSGFRLFATEITAQNGSQPFIGGDFLATIANRLILGNIVGGDGNQTGTVTGAAVVTGGTGYPATGSVLFTGGGGQSATGTFTAVAGVITSITVTNGGTGFLSAPTPEIVGTTGTGFTGTATISGFTTNSTDTKFPDYVGWSFPSAYGSFDPNSTLLGGGFDQLTEARGLITGLAVFEAVAFVAHNGGFTEMVPNTSGTNIQPFTFAPLWSADQGVVCRYGSMAQYGAECRFLGYDQPYMLSPGGLVPFGDPVASLLQNFSLWNDGHYLNAGLYGSIVEIEGEKHYLLGFSSNQPVPLVGVNQLRNTKIFDANLKTGSWNVWTYPGITMTCPVYQSYDFQVMAGVTPNLIIDRDNLLLIGLAVSGGSGGNFESPRLGQVMAGEQLYPIPISTTRYGNEFYTYQFRAETPSLARPQTNRRLLVEYENLPTVPSGTAALTCTIYGQPDRDSTGTFPAPITNQFVMNLPYFPLSATVPAHAVLSATGEPSGTAITSLASSIQIVCPNQLRIVRVSLVAETTQSEMQ